MTNVSIPEVNMLKNSSTLDVSVSINLSIKLDFFCKRPQGFTAVEQAVAFAPITQGARVRSPVRTSFLGEVFSFFFSHL